MPESNEIMSVEGQLVGMPLAGPESFSAQQLDYLKRALGVDETVLWEGKQVAGNTVALSESAANFEKLAVFVSSEDAFITAPTKFETLQENSATYGTIIRPGGEVAKSIIAQETGLYVWGGEIKLKDTTCQIGSFRRWHAGSASPTDHTSLTFLFRVVGIHRISGGN